LIAEGLCERVLGFVGLRPANGVARLFARSVRTIRRYRKRYAHGGMAALSADQYLSGFFDPHDAAACIDEDFGRGLADPNLSASCSAA
jgi:hypothetical protein